jgi:hypothetical protein
MKIKNISSEEFKNWLTKNDNNDEKNTLENILSFTTKNPSSWEEKEIGCWLDKIRLSDNNQIKSIFQTENILGDTLLLLSKDDLNAIKITKLGDKLALEKEIKKIFLLDELYLKFIQIDSNPNSSPLHSKKKVIPIEDLEKIKSVKVIKIDDISKFEEKKTKPTIDSIGKEGPFKLKIFNISYTLNADIIKNAFSSYKVIKKIKNKANFCYSMQ